MNLKNFVDGVNLLRHYFTDPNGYHIGAEHDEFFVYATDRPVSPEDLVKLDAMGWSQPEVDEDAPYDPAEGWRAFV